MKTIKDAVIELSGKYPSAIPEDISSQHCKLYVNSMGTYIPANDVCAHDFVCTRQEFESTAKGMGYISGYEWGKEYHTNGKRPDIPVGIIVSCTIKDSVGQSWIGCVQDMKHWDLTDRFHIIDSKYKPADEASELFNSEMTFAGKVTVEPAPQNNSWHERGELPPVGAIVAYHDDDGYVKTGYVQHWIEGDELEILSYKTVNKVNLCVVFNKRAEEAQCLVTDCMLPIRTHREKVIEAAVDVICKGSVAVSKDGTEPWRMANALYSAGMLVLPQDSSDTED